jgi:hypothetical protein
MQGLQPPAKNHPAHNPGSCYTCPSCVQAAGAPPAVASREQLQLQLQLQPGPGPHLAAAGASPFHVLRQHHQHHWSHVWRETVQSWLPPGCLGSSGARQHSTPPLGAPGCRPLGGACGATAALGRLLLVGAGRRWWWYPTSAAGAPGRASHQRLLRRHPHTACRGKGGRQGGREGAGAHEGCIVRQQVWGEGEQGGPRRVRARWCQGMEDQNWQGGSIG